MQYLKMLNESFPVRRSREQKAAFRAYVKEELQAKGLDVRVETTKDGKNENLIVGDPTSARVVLTAHYDTPAASLFPNMMIPRNLLLFWILQLLPVFVILALSFGGGYVLSLPFGGDDRAFLIGFLVLYYGIYFLGFRVFQNRHNHNDNTSGVSVLLSVAARLNAEELRETALIFFDNEELGKKGSKAYFKDHRDEMKERLVLNFDCVGYGDQVIFIARKGAEAHEGYRRLCATDAEEGRYQVHFYPAKGSESNSDYKSFPCGVGCMTCKKGAFGVMYTPRIHTAWDTVADEENIAYLTEYVFRFLKETRTQNECRMQNAECRMQNECRTQNAECRMQNAE